MKKIIGCMIILMLMGLVACGSKENQEVDDKMKETKNDENSNMAINTYEIGEFCNIDISKISVWQNNKEFITNDEEIIAELFNENIEYIATNDDYDDMEGGIVFNIYQNEEWTYVFRVVKENIIGIKKINDSEITTWYEVKEYPDYSSVKNKIINIE